MSQPAPTAAQSAEPQPREQQAETPPAPADQPAAQQPMDAAPAQTLPLRRAGRVLETLDVEQGRGLQRAPTQRVLFVLRVVGPDLPTDAPRTAEPAAEAAPAKQ